MRVLLLRSLGRLVKVNLGLDAGSQITHGIAKLETNRMNIKVSELLALSQILHCDVGEFFKNLI